MAKRKTPSILFVVPAPPGISPGQRFRYEHYLPYLDNAGIKYHVQNFYSSAGWKTLYTRKHKLTKSIFVLGGIFKRLLTLFKIPSYRYVYVYREATPIGPAFFEWAVTKVFRKKLIYDFDDAIWLPFTSEFNKGVSWLRNFGKVARNCKRATIVTVGNKYLAAFAGKYNRNVLIIPTVVNTKDVHNVLQNQHATRPAVGWTGSFSTLHYLQIVLPVLQRLQDRFDFEFIVIADMDPALPLKNYRFIKWNKETESKDLLTFHIGIMPLNDDDISRGKCGFKAIQYMSLGIPSIVSPVGVNSEIVSDGINGFIASTEKEWEEKLALLLTSEQKRLEFGQAARMTIETKYSVEATKDKFVELFTT